LSAVKTKIDFVIEGELAEKLEAYVERGLFASKPEVVRDELRHLFEHLEEVDLQRARKEMMVR
jgi:Arc/MetJ-type ribon-helix-helix transcriptional regulator